MKAEQKAEGCTAQDCSDTYGQAYLEPVLLT